jgi:hypothetical protein
MDKQLDIHAIRRAAQCAREDAQREELISEYPRHGRAVYERKAEALDELADTLAATGAEAPAESAYAQRKAERIERLRVRAARLRVASATASANSHQIVSRIPFGQPILVGHHSERHHRNTLARAESADRKAYELHKQAHEVAIRARGAEHRRAIDSDDPDAPDKLRAKVADLERQRERMKFINAEYRRCRGNIDAMQVGDAEKARVRSLLAHWEPWMGKAFKPFDGYALQNLGANLRRYQERLKSLEQLPAATEAIQTTYGNVTIETDTNGGRINVITPGRNDLATAILRGRGFCWSRMRRCWVRKLTPAAVAIVPMIGKQLEEVYK